MSSSSEVLVVLKWKFLCFRCFSSLIMLLIMVLFMLRLSFSVLILIVVLFVIFDMMKWVLLFIDLGVTCS